MLFNTAIVSAFVGVVIMPFQASTLNYVRAEDEPPPAKVVIHHEEMIAEITAYTSSEDETDDTPFLTASGQETRTGIAACPARYAFGTKIIIDGEEFECQDRMATRFRNGNHFDLWFATKEKALQFGRQHLKIKILE